MSAERRPRPPDAAGPLISVPLCCFNGARYLDEQIASVLAQRDVRLELIVVDDASSDDSFAKLQSWESRDARVKAYRNERNLGFVRNFESTLRRCGGELIAPCDQDDIWHADKLIRLSSELGSHVLAYCDSRLIDETGQDLGRRVSDSFGMYSGADPLALTFWNCVSGHAMLFKRELLDHALPIPPGVAFHDWWLAHLALRHGAIAYVDEALVAYRQHAASQTDVAQRKSIRRDSQAIYRQRQAWFDAMAAADGKDQAWFASLAELWRDRGDAWFCPALLRQLLTKRQAWSQTRRRGGATSFALQQFIGMRFRRSPP